MENLAFTGNLLAVSRLTISRSKHPASTLEYIIRVRYIHRKREITDAQDMLTKLNEQTMARTMAWK